MTHVITTLCTRQGDCVEVCPVDCIVPAEKDDPVWGKLFYIDPDTCIDCGACVPECPFDAIFPEDEVPSAYKAKGGELISQIGLTGHYEGVDHHGNEIKLNCTRPLKAGEVVDLTNQIATNKEYFSEGPGYKALEG